MKLSLVLLNAFFLHLVATAVGEPIEAGDGGGGLRRKAGDGGEDDGTNEIVTMMMANPFFGQIPYKDEMTMSVGTVVDDDDDDIIMDCGKDGEDASTVLPGLIFMTSEELMKADQIPETGLILLDMKPPGCVPKTVLLEMRETGDVLMKDGTMMDREGDKILTVMLSSGVQAIPDIVDNSTYPIDLEEEGMDLAQKSSSETNPDYDPNTNDNGRRNLANPYPLGNVWWQRKMIWKSFPCWKRGWTAETRAWAYSSGWEYTNIQNIRTKAYVHGLDHDLCGNCYYEASSKKHTYGCWSSGCVTSSWNQAKWYEGGWIGTVTTWWNLGCP